MTEKKMGRPPKYTEEQVIEGIEIVERAGEVPTGDAVKKVMCEQLGVAAGINAQSLDKEVQRLRDERERQRRDQRIAALPAETLGAANEIGTLVERAVLGHLGDQYETLRMVANKKVHESNIDLCNQRAQISDLLSKLEGKESYIAELESEKHDLKEQLKLATSEIETLKKLVAGNEWEEDFRSRILEMMKETLGQKVGATTEL